ncbi:asparagine synthase (glutamine-hydrolyzing) [Lacrimispora celerecrescens]|uniref:asparagine synthase (glutamine-hydrolyzing) n=1 Tax=Lacrimispora celerecrescens TaxID=29354 RepID=A0A084JQV0_9FIRM|nr:asparagine synthase (glutamine-hydrolyzing) [Lacrimispora celerecrescens]KEZ91334.1 asparagine synthase [Lacrimispora celerecrescens]
MCGIAGFYNPVRDYQKDKAYYENILKQMSETQRHRGPDDSGIWLFHQGGMSHARLSVIDLTTGRQPITKTEAGKTFGIVYNGEIYNTKELRQDLKDRGHSFSTSSDTEVILTGYMEYGPDFVKQLNGIFAFAIMDPYRECLCLCRDRSGIKPLYYTIQDGEIIFASELKGIFAYPGIRPVIDRKGLNEIFSLGPAHTSGCGVFKRINEILPGHMLLCSKDGFHLKCYWKLESRPHEDSYEETIEKTSFLVQDSIRRQMVSDVPICTFLSGGVDSSLVSAVCAAELKKQGRQLTTFSFDFVNNDKFFKASTFQPSQDRPYVDQMVNFLDSDHHYLECDNGTQADRLYDSVLAHDLPAMGDIDSSLLHFCSMVKQFNKVALTGECADEIFGGYPWFHKEECFKAHTFPWTMDLGTRKAILKDEFLDYLKMDEYVLEAYEKSVAETPVFSEDNPTEARRREISYLNLRWFMQTLLNRMDRDSMYSGLEARVPFADHRIIEYVWNVPWDMKTRDGVVKNLLRQAGRGLLPDEILFRRKSPYPKTYDTNYEALLAGRVEEMVAGGSAPVMEFLDGKKLEKLLSSPSDYGKPWYGQLMAGPQMLAYILQINYWLEKYQITVE